MSKITKSSFLSRYSLTIVMIPSIIGIHYGWYIMQQNRTLVRADEQIEMPPVQFAKYCWARLQGLDPNTSKSADPSVVDAIVAPAAK